MKNQEVVNEQRIHTTNNRIINSNHNSHTNCFIHVRSRHYKIPKRTKHTILHSNNTLHTRIPSDNNKMA